MPSVLATTQKPASGSKLTKGFGQLVWQRQGPLRPRSLNSQIGSVPRPHHTRPTLLKVLAGCTAPLLLFPPSTKDDLAWETSFGGKMQHAWITALKVRHRVCIFFANIVKQEVVFVGLFAFRCELPRRITMFVGTLFRVFRTDL